MKQILRVLVLFALVTACNNKTNEPAKEDAMPPSEAATMKPSEFADPSYADYGKRFISNFTKGDIDAWTNDLADNAVFVWSSGDSVAGKAAIGTYWKKRWTALDSITFSNEIWLPITVNQPQSIEAPGTWLLGWYMFNEKFKNGKRVIQFAHDAMHFNSDNKIDRVVHYVDMAPIKAAMGK